MGYGVILTGSPGVGKTTCVLKVVQSLKRSGVQVGGFYTQEVRVEGRRIGFKIVDVQSGREGWLAKINGGSGPRIGKYLVMLGDLNEIGVAALRKALTDPRVQVIVVDEVGPMEMVSDAFKKTVEEVTRRGNVFLFTVHWSMADRFAVKAREKAAITLIHLTYINRDEAPANILNIVNSFLRDRAE
ncbi:MAG: NTPase [Candidatus Bathyarchaeia archaeon]